MRDSITKQYEERDSITKQYEDLLIKMGYSCSTGYTTNWEDRGLSVKEYEDLKIKYSCSTGYTTNWEDRGLSVKEALFLLDNDIINCTNDLKCIFSYRFFWEETPFVVRRVLIDLRYALGYTGFRKFKRAIEAINHKKYNTFIKELIDSKWYRGKGKHRLDDNIELIAEWLST